ncbi:putative PIG3 family NAD(P)H quinone oxidoreductase [Georgenia soli]|uniref:Putative PIG3 family NAD(P)H quinone oxidoreductase n=1 Tax=Georgenia soli TaxID=638953 RepID=A0A2A9EK99_9MICO|nr:NAD(P)H-quinone oxidoreductase [Georgenia soli]PFG39374.1 putative PIG3 family NAD(P)H quinone oxidoreductase [Georgenia soli]
MRAITVTDDSALELTDVTDPRPGPGEVLLKVAAAGLNRADILQRAGHYPPPPGASDILGLEVSGTVAAVGEGVTGWKLGEQACALLAGGGYAELVAVPAGQLLPVPAGLDLVDAAALPEAACTAWSNLVGVAGLRAGETVLIHGGSGGVGSVAIQLASAVGARVLTTAGGPERTARCRELGADVAIDHRSEDVAAAVQEATDGRGADVILDVLGAGGLDQNVRSLATGGRLVVIGTQKGRKGEIDLGRLMTRRASLHATTLRARPLEEKAAIVADVRERVWPMLDDGRLRPVVADRLPLAEAARAHELLDSGNVFGKVLLVP